MTNQQLWDKCINSFRDEYIIIESYYKDGKKENDENTEWEQLPSIELGLFKVSNLLKNDLSTIEILDIELRNTASNSITISPIISKEDYEKINKERRV